MKFTVGVFAKLEEQYDTESGSIVEKITYKCNDWADASGISYWKTQGQVLVKTFEIEFNDEASREEVVTGMIEGLRTKKDKTLADAQAEATKIDRQINKLLALAYEPSTKPAGEFAPRKTQDDITDIYDQGAGDNFTF